MKACIKCESHGPFYKDKSKKDGLRPYCKECENKVISNYKLKNLDRVREKIEDGIILGTIKNSVSRVTEWLLLVIN